MLQINTGRFDGSLSELTVYHLAILDTSHYVRLFMTHAQTIQNEVLIRPDETDAACSWCIVESIKRAFPEVRVLNHELNSNYEAVYDQYFLGEENDIRRKLFHYLQIQKQVKTFKVMPMLDKTLVAIGT